MAGAYHDAKFVEAIDGDLVKTVYEIGSRDCLDALKLAKRYDAKVHTFECNQDTIETCRKNAKKDDRITLVEKAVSISDGEIIFYPFDKEKHNNPGASSMFIHTFSNMSPNDEWKDHPCVQKTVTVPSVRLDTYYEENDIPDLICMDTQGAELIVLKSAGELLKKTRYIIAECSFNSSYAGAVSFPDLNKYLESMGFKLKAHNFYGGVNFPSPKNDYQSEFDSLWELQ